MEHQYNENYTSDKPILNKENDAFQRFEFSKRIADTISERKNQDSIVFGIFGIWGEGKSTVLNFINQELMTSGNILTLSFNPWRYGDEDNLIKNFLKKVAELLGKELDSNKEKFAGFIGKYGSIGSVFGVDLSDIGKNIATVDLEELKNRVDEFLNESAKRLVIFIDDIDRLDKQEIYSLFRLVKLTADFKNTTYILSFDQEMVASAIGDRFGSGDKKAGENFLEKIIQVPLTIPKAQPDALKKFCFLLVDNAINNSKIELSKEEVQRFVYQFTTNILNRLNTPRLAVRYGNTLSFSMPLLKGEVNLVDLMLIEALRVFYPNHYSFVKNNPDYFIGSYSRIYETGNDENKINSIKEHFNRLENELHENDKPKVRDLLSNLFPRLDTAFGNYHFGNETYNEWYLQKRIVSTKYFDRYFSYAVIEGDISDVEFKLLLETIAQTDNIDEITKKVTDLIERTSKDNFLHKLRSLEKEYSWDSAKKIAKTICNISEKLPKEGGMMSMGFETPFGQAAIFILQLMKYHKKEKDLFDFAVELMNYPKLFNFAYEINNWLRSGERKEDKLFSDEQYQELAKVLTERALSESKDNSIFESFPDYIGYLAHTWAERDKPGFDKYVEDYLNKKKENVIYLLQSYVPTVRSSAKPEPFKGDLTKDRYEYLVSFYSKDDLNKRILEIYSLEEIQSEEPFWIDIVGDKDYTDLNMVRQFTRWHLREKEGNKEKTAGNT